MLSWISQQREVRRLSPAQQLRGRDRRACAGIESNRRRRQARVRRCGVRGAARAHEEEKGKLAWDGVHPQTTTPAIGKAPVDAVILLRQVMMLLSLQRRRLDRLEDRCLEIA